MRTLINRLKHISKIVIYTIITPVIIGSCKSDISIVDTTSSFIIVDNNLCYPPIVISPNATSELIEATHSLANYIFKISGKRPEIISELKGRIPNTAIWVGINPPIDLFKTIDLNLTHPEEILITCTDKHLLIIGNDVQNNQYASINAIYTFIQNYLGVRWLWPGELGEQYPTQSKISFKPFAYRFSPSINARVGLFWKLAGDRVNPNNKRSKWIQHQRIFYSSVSFNGGHAFSSWWDDYNKTKPSIFAKQANGKRELVDIPERVKLCQSNPEVWNLWLENVGRILLQNPNQTIFNASPNDGYNKGHCTCENCTSWDSKPMDDPDFITTDRDIIFANTLADLLEKKYPNKNYFVQIHAYGLSRKPPSIVRPKKNVIVSCVANFHMRGEGTGDYRTEHMKQFDQWSKISTHIFWRPNLGNPVGLWWGLPDVAMTQAGEDMRFISKRNCNGLFFDTFWEHWGTQAPQYYILSQLAWDPNLNVDSVMNDFYQNAYGNGWKEMKNYWEFMEDTRNGFIQSNLTRYRAFDIPDLYTANWFKTAFIFLDKAESAVEYKSKSFKRIQFAKSGLVYSKKVVDIRKSMRDLYEKNPTLENRKIVENLWDEMQVLKDQTPKYCINFNAVFKQPQGKRMMGLHPDNLIKGKAKWKMLKDKGLE